MGKLIWLASYPKSGNTWLRAFLHNFLRQPAEPYPINRLTDFCLGDSDAALYQHHTPRPVASLSVGEIQRLRPLVHQDLTRAFPDLVFTKTHNAALVVAGVPLVTPAVTAAAIYLIRDPRDVAVSLSHHLALDLDRTIAFMADQEAALGGTPTKVYEKLSSWSVHVESWVPQPHPRLLVLRYEDLAANPTDGFGDVIRFLGREPEPARLTRAIEFSGFDRLASQERAAGFIERPAHATAFFREGTPGAWAQHLSPAQARQIEQDHRPTMARFGYL